MENNNIMVQMQEYQITASKEYILRLPENYYLSTIAEYYKIGNIVYVSYWNIYDLVLDFKITDNGTWMVQVIECDINGTPLPDKTERWHCTSPDKNDKIIGATPSHQL